MPLPKPWYMSFAVGDDASRGYKLGYFRGYDDSQGVDLDNPTNPWASDHPDLPAIRKEDLWRGYQMGIKDGIADKESGHRVTVYES